MPLTIIKEDEPSVVALPEQKEEEVIQRKRTLTQRLSAIWKSRSRSKSVSPEKKVNMSILEQMIKSLPCRVQVQK